MTQQNASVAAQSSEIANATNIMAKTIVDEANKADFIGKGAISNTNKKPILSKPKPEIQIS
jgi:thiamine monophosphate synthase